MSLAFDLTPVPKRKLVVVKKEKIQILQQVRFRADIEPEESVSMVDHGKAAKP